MSKITVYFTDNESKEFTASGYDVLSCGVLAIRSELKPAVGSLIASLTKEVTVGIPLSSVKYYEVSE